jgi:hypothetical protein
MKLMKLTSFTIFFILLIVLLISVVFAYVIPEGFISYNSNGGNLSQLVVPPYSSNMIYKVYDSIYFDPNSGNVIELFGVPGGSNNTDSTVNSLTNIIVMPELGGSVNQYDKTGTSPFSNNMVETSIVGTSITNSLNSWVYPGANTFNTLNFNYQVLYFPWNKDIVIVIYNIIDKKFQGVYTFFSGSSSAIEYNIPSSVTIPTTNIPDTSSSNNSFIDTDTSSSNNSFIDTEKITYQVSQNVTFDVNANKLSINRMSQTPSSGANNAVGPEIVNVNGPNAVAVSDPKGGNVVLAVPFSNNRTMVCVICPDPANTQLMSIRNVDRFDPSVAGGVVNGTINNNITTPPVNPTTTTTPVQNCKNQVDLNNYLLKSQVVPPVCPACSACPNVNNNISCPGCGGGSGGSGNDISNNTLSSIIANAYAQTLQSQQYGGGFGGGGGGNNSLGGVSNNLINNTAGLGNTAMNNATGLIAGAGSGAEHLAGHTVSTAGDIVSETVETAGDVIKSAIGGTVDLSKALAGNITTLGTGATDVAGKAVTGATALGVGAEMGATTLGMGAIGSVNNAVNTVGNIGNGHGGQVGQNSRGSAGNYLGDTQGNRGYMSSNTSSSNTGFITSGTPGYNEYYGAVPQKPSTTFIPVTSDFSKFGR